MLGRSLATGVIAGAVLLGAGARVAMRGVAMLEGRTPVWTFRGTWAVVTMGAVFGALLALLWAVASSWLPGNRVVRGLLFGGLAAAICSPGLTPQRLSTFVLFVPWFLGYGLTMSLLTRPVGREAHVPSP